MTAFLLTTVAAMPQQKVYSLPECRQMALQNNVKMRDAKLAIEQAKEQKKEAYTKYFPTVSASGTYFKSVDDLIKKDISLTNDQQTQIAQIMQQMGLNPSVLSSLPTTFSISSLNHGIMANVMAMQPIYAGGQITNGNKLAQLQTEVRELQLNQNRDEILNTTEQYYNSLLTLYEKRHTLDVVDRQLTRIHDDADNAYKVGVTNKNDVLSVELKQNEIATSRLKLENGINVCKLVLAQYIGVYGTDFEIDTTLVGNLPNPATYLVDHNAALDGRTEAQLLDKNVEASKLQRKLAQGAQLPTVAVGAAGIYHDLTGKSRLNALGLVNVSVPISDIWTGSHKVKQKEIAERMAVQDREDNRQLLLIQMQSDYDNLTNAYAQILLARKSMEKSAENLRLNEDYYHAGTATMSDLLEAQTRDQQSRDQYTDAVAQYLNCRTAYLLATNRSIE